MAGRSANSAESEPVSLPSRAVLGNHRHEVSGFGKGDIAGIHSVIFGTVGETVTLNHNAQSRDGFARGALRAAEWLIDKEQGLYSMADCLGLK